MTYNPIKLNNKAIVMCVLCAVIAIVLYVTSAFVTSFGVVYQITAIIFAVFSLQIYIKYIACDYVYKACDKDLKIYKVNGKKSICIASLSYDESKSRVMFLSEYNANKKTLPKHSYTVNYAKNLYPDNYCLYLFNFNGKTVRMKFEPDDKFVCYINSLIDKVVVKSNDSEN